MLVCNCRNSITGKTPNFIDATRKAIVVEIQLGQTAQGKDTTWKTAGKIVAIQIQKDQLGQVFNLRRNAAGQSACSMPHAANSKKRPILLGMVPTRLFSSWRHITQRSNV
jgi:hypothetical protein